jgi:hypothetical protein
MPLHTLIRYRMAIYRQTPLTILALTRVALDHLIAGLKAGESHVCDRVLLVVSLLCRYDRRKCRQGEVNTREAASLLSQFAQRGQVTVCYSRDKVSLEFVQVNVERTVESKGGCD